MPTIENIVDYVEHLKNGGLNRDEGVLHGDPARDISGLTISWLPSPQAIESTANASHDLLISHENLYFPLGVTLSDNPPDNWEKWCINRQRRELLDQYDLPLLRLHGSLDEICIFDVFADFLGFDTPIYSDGLVKIFETRPTPFSELIEQVKKKTSMASLRVADAGVPNKLVKRIGLPWGGLGLFTNVGYQQRLIEAGCDAFIAGESDNLGLRFATECGIPIIETSHEISENPGLEHFATMLSDAFPDLDVSFFNVECVWRTA